MSEMQRLKRVFAIDIETCPDCGGTLRVIACSCLAGEDSGGSAEARVASVVRNKPPILVGMPEKVVNNSLRRHAMSLLKKLIDEHDFGLNHDR